MRLLYSVVRCAALAGVVALVSAGLECKNEADHKKEYTTNGKIFKLHCNTEIQPKEPVLESVKLNVPEECADLCAKKAGCGHSNFNQKYSRCILRPKPTSYDDRSLAGSVGSIGNSWAWVYDRDVPPPPPPTSDKPPGGNTPDPTPPGNTGNPPPPGNTGAPSGDTGSGSGWTGNQPSYECPKDHKKLFSFSGRTFELLCDHGNPSTGFQNIPNVNSIGECAKRCAQEPRCKNAEYHTSDGVCELEPDHNPIAFAGYHLWVPKMCPDPPRAQKPNAKPQQTTDLTVAFDTSTDDNCKFLGFGNFSTVHKPGIHYHYATDPPTTAPNLFESKRCSTECPDADGQIFASPTGENFVMSCKKRHGTTYLKETPDRYPTFAACMKACGALPACLSVDYHMKTKNCYFSTNSKHPTVNAASFVSAHSAGCSGACASCNASSCAGLDKGPLGPEKYTCNEHRGRSITVKGIDFVIACEHAINSHPFKEVPAKDHAQCVELCAAETSCGGANWIGGRSATTILTRTRMAARPMSNSASIPTR
ncbi:uncharacterized protein PG998_004489 [Apiospora kogelbergensis]|uniref:uncharacterized protein n=1 Tax=Apiospora kogelbergensis TaxID=1337665 RepID=UPI00312E9BBA